MRIKKFLVSLIICLITGISAFSISSCDQTEQPQDPSSGNEQTDGENNGGAEQKTEYTVTYNANGGVFADGNATMSAKTEKDAVLTAPASPQRTYYKFNGWSKNSSGTEIWNFATDTVTGDLTLYAVWKQEGAVIFSVDGASIENKEIFMLVNHTVDSVSLANKIVCSDESVWKLYYDKLGQMEIPTKIAASSYGELDDGDNVFYIVVTSNDGTQVNVYELNVYRSYAVNVNYYDGNTLLKTETAYTGYEFTTTYTPNITGYTFNDWNYTARVLWDGLNLYADKTANTYKVTYDVNGGDELTTTEKTVTYDSDYTLTKPTRTGYTFLGWYYGSTQLTNSNGSSLESWGYASDKTATAKWQANEYTVTLNRNNTSAGTVTGAGDHAYDSNVTVTASTNAGYTWLGWYDKNDELVTIEYSYSFKMGFAVEYTAKWGKTTVTRNNTSAGTVTSLTGKYVNGQEITVTANTNSGYTWLGWYNDETLLTKELSYTFTMTSENVTYTAKWTYYTLTTDTNLSEAGTYTTYTNKKITVGTETTLTASTNSGYTWLGWYSGDTLLTEELSCTFKMSEESVTYTAKWEVKEEMRLFIFTSTATTCTITGITDETVTEIVVPEYVTSISKGAFYGCNDLESITIPFVGAVAGKTASDTYQYPFGYIFGTYNYTGATATKQYYYGSSTSSTTYDTYYIPTSLKSVTVTGGNILYGAFYNCRSLTSITIPDNVTSIGDYAFYECRGLTSITIPDSVTSIGERAFYNCSSLTSVTIGDGVTSIGNYAFRGCSSLTSITIPDNVTSIGGSAFSGCKGLTSITIPDSVTSIGEEAFEYCSSLTSITIPNSVTSIGYGAFYDCSSLTSVTIGDGVTSIGEEAFEYCSSLTSITIPNSVTSIGYGAFYDCDSLTSVYYKGTAEEWSEINMDSNNTELTSATRYYYIENEADVPTDGGNYWHYVDGVPTSWVVE